MDTRSGMPAASPFSDIVSTFRPAKLFRREDIHKSGEKSSEKPIEKEAEKVTEKPRILSLDYDDKGELLMTSESDESIQIYNVLEGRHTKSLLSMKYGVKLAKFSHATQGVIYASTKQNDAIRYLSTHDNTFIRYFEGHEASVTCLAIHPGDDQFISCSQDNTVRIWNAKSRQWTGTLYLHHPSLVAYDPSATTFAVASPSCGSVLLYDSRNFEKAPFSTFDLIETCRHIDPQLVAQGWTKLEFANDGKTLLVGTRGGGHFVLDAFDGSLKAYLRKPNGGTRRAAPGENPVAAASSAGQRPNPPLWESSGDCGYALDGRYVLSGSKRDVLVWDLQASAEDNKILDPAHVLEDRREASVLAINPRYNFFATADQEVLFWTPETNA